MLKNILLLNFTPKVIFLYLFYVLGFDLLLTYKVESLWFDFRTSEIKKAWLLIYLLLILQLLDLLIFVISSFSYTNAALTFY